MPAHSGRARAGGFTLVEVLVVVVIIAIMTTIAMLKVTTPGYDRQLDGEGERFTDVITAATEQAQLEGRDYGVWFGPNRYQVLVYTPATQHWDELPDDRLYEEHGLPDGVVPALEMEGKAVPIDVAKVDAERVPQLMLFSSGDASPYKLSFAREGTDTKWLVEGQPDGTMAVTPSGPAP